MTTLLDPPDARWTSAPSTEPPPPAPLAPRPPQVAPPAPVRVPVDGRRLRALLLIWLLALGAGMAFVVYGLGPFFQQREQRHLMRSYRGEVSRAANEASGLQGVSVATKAPDPGAAVGVLEVGSVRIQQVVVEGAEASQTRAGPGHVPGTAGLGQPGNSVVVGRRTAFGAPFASIKDLRKGDKILITTTQGQSVYVVDSLHRTTLRGPKDENDTAPSVIDRVYGPSKDDRLTLVTSAGSIPWNKSVAWVAVAKMEGTPFAPTPQGGRRDAVIGTRGDPGAVSSIILVLILFGLVMGASIVLYRRLQPRTAYLLTIAPIVALTIIAAETFSRAFPAWM